MCKVAHVSLHASRGKLGHASAFDVFGMNKFSLSNYSMLALAWIIHRRPTEKLGLSGREGSA
jgi:hypothetical protein